MSFITIDVLGLAETLARFAGLEAAAKAAERPLAEAEAVPVEAKAKAIAPVDTGTLRDSIHIEPDPGSSDVLVATDVRYAPFVEYGTAYTPAQPFLRPAVDDASVGAAAGGLIGGLLGL